MKATPDLNFTVVKSEQGSLNNFVQMIRNVYQNLVQVINGQIGFGDGTNQDNINGSWINVVAPVAPNTDFTVNHNLNRIPSGYWIMEKDRAVDVYTGSIAATSTQLTLRATVASAVLRLFIIGLLLGFFATRSEAQGVRHVNTAQGTVTLSPTTGFSKPILIPIPGATITVCTGSTLPPVGTTCSGLASIYVDIALTGLLSNPTNADSNGNYSFYAVGGLPYVVSVSAVGFTTFSYVWSAPTSNSSPSFNNPAFTGLATAVNLTVSGTLTGNGPVNINNQLLLSGSLAALFGCRIENVRYVDVVNLCNWSGSDLAGWIASAYTDLPQHAGTVIVTNGSYATPSASITVGTIGCPNAPTNGWSQTLIFDGVQVTVNNFIKVLCGGYFLTTGNNPFGSWITAGASLPAGPMVKIGDSVNGNINAGISGLRLNANNIAGITGIQAQGIQDLSFINNNLIQNYLVNGINVDCSTTAGGGNFTVNGNDLNAATGAADGIVINACNGAEIIRNSITSNTGVAITAASLKVFGNTNNQEPITVSVLHSEKHTDACSLDGAASAIFDGCDVANGTINTVHIKGTATGSVFVRNAHNNAVSTNPVILNDVTTLSLASNNPPSPNGIQLSYQWMNNQYEQWIDTSGFHTGPGSSGNPGKLLWSFSAPGISTHFNTSGDSIIANGSSSFTITVGSGTANSIGILNLPTASNGWNCWLNNHTRAALIQSSGTTTTATFTNLGTTFSATNWTNGDVLRGGCNGN